VESMGEFNTAVSHFLRRGGHVIDLFEENTQREVVGHVFPSGAFE
jgi:hypothetical protein